MGRTLIGGVQVALGLALLVLLLLLCGKLESIHVRREARKLRLHLARNCEGGGWAEVLLGWEHTQVRILLISVCQVLLLLVYSFQLLLDGQLLTCSRRKHRSSAAATIAPPRDRAPEMENTY